MSSLLVDSVHPATQAVAAMNAALDDFAEASLWSMSIHEVAAVVIAAEKLANRLDSVKVAVVAQAEKSLVRTLGGAKTTHGWLHTAADVPKWQGRARLQLAHALESRPVTAAAFAAGEISMDAAGAVCTAIQALPPSVPAAMSTEVEDLLLATARQEGSRQVTRAAMEITYRFAPEVLEEQEAAARAARHLTLTTRGDGTVAIKGPTRQRSRRAPPSRPRSPGRTQPGHRWDPRPTRHPGPLRRRVHSTVPTRHPAAAPSTRRTTQRRDHHEHGKPRGQDHRRDRLRTRHARHRHCDVHRSRPPRAMRRQRDSDRARQPRRTPRHRPRHPHHPHRHPTRTSGPRPRL